MNLNGAQVVPAVVQLQPLHLVLRERQLTIEAAQAIILELGAILVRYGANNDLLSQKLMVAGHTFMLYAASNLGIMPPNEVLRGGIEKIIEIKTILKNPFAPSIFREPWLVDGVVTWEKATLDAHQASGRRFGGQDVEAVPHNFAQEVLNWIGQLPVEIPEPVLLLQGAEQRVVQHVALSPEVRDYQDYMQCMHIIERTKELQGSLVIIRQLEEAKLILEQANEEGFRRFEADLARMEQNQRQQNAELGRGLVAIQTQQQETVALYQEANDVANATLIKVKVELDAAHIELNRQQHQIYSLCAQLNSQQQQLNNMDRGGFCTIQ